MQKGKSLVLGCILALAILPLAGAVDHASADNLLLNGDFETGDMTSWDVFGQIANASVVADASSNGPAAPGTYNAFMSNMVDGHGLTLKQSTEAGNAIAGVVEYSFDLKVAEAALGGVLFVEIWAEQDGGGIIGGSGLMGPYFDAAWTTHAGSFTAPANTSFLTIQIMANTGATIGSTCLVHVDNVVLDQGTVAAESLSWSGVKSLYR